MSKQKTIEYKPTPFRIEESTHKEMKRMRKKLGLSWNLFFKLLIDTFNHKEK